MESVDGVTYELYDHVRVILSMCACLSSLFRSYHYVTLSFLCRQRPRYVMLDHISSQPSVVLPLAEMIAACRACPSVQEIAVDAAHAVNLRIILTFTNRKGNKSAK